MRSKESFKSLFQNIDKWTVFVAIGITLSFSYFLNPLSGVEVSSWDRTFSPALISGISIDKRIGHFYFLFLFELPIIFFFSLLVVSFIFKKRIKYQDFLIRYNSFSIFSVIASYISRYSPENYEISREPILYVILGFWIILTVTGVLDKDELLSFSDIVLLFLSYVILYTLCTICFHYGARTTVFVLVIVCGGGAIVLRTFFVGHYYKFIKSFFYLMLWLPAIIRLTLEWIYLLTEKGLEIQNYLTILSCVALVSIFSFAGIALVIRKKNVNLTDFGYIGFVISLSSLSFFQYNYQYVWSYQSYANIYELGNNTVAVDTILYGKLPIFDYFSAHALTDVWTRIIYCLIHKDMNGILVNPYGGLASVIGLVICYFIIREIFDRDISIMYITLFPAIARWLKWESICLLSIAMLIYIYKNANVKRYILFWIALLLSAVTLYDEGMYLGIACILAYLIFSVTSRKWREMRLFAISGGMTGGTILLFYIIYGYATGLPIVSRMKEWMSVSAGSSSSWATSDFGNPSTFAFLISYFVVPGTAIFVLFYMIINYQKNRRNELIVLLTMAFSLAEILYIPRTVVYHNLAVCSGNTGVLLNFIHWSVPLCVLYIFSIEERRRFSSLVWMATMMFVILVESTAVIGQWPSSDSTILSKSLRSANEWNVSNHTIENIGQRRIVYDEDSTKLVNMYKNLFDTLLTEEQTFLDFANITSMYMLTNRVRPSYVGQTPSLLTDNYSQDCYLQQLAEYDCPLAIIGASETVYLTAMISVPHNVRYYKIAEYIYSNYRPLISFDEIAIWCRKDCYEKYHSILEYMNVESVGYSLIDYGYDFTEETRDEYGTLQFVFKPGHSYNLGMIPYIWSNFDQYNASDNEELTEITLGQDNICEFSGSQSLNGKMGNYLSFEVINSSEGAISENIVFNDSLNQGAMFQYYFTAPIGTNHFLIRVSEDYFWDEFNVDTIRFAENENLKIGKVKILKGDGL